MKYRLCSWLGILLLASLAQAQFIFEDVTRQLGLSEPLQAWRTAHGIAVGDCTGDGLPDLYLGAFADRPLFKQPGAPLPNMLFLNTAGRFTLSPDDTTFLIGKKARTTMALFVDLNNDGRLDLVVGNHVNRQTCRSMLFENLGQGRFRDATPQPPDWLTTVSTRNIAVLDFNRDGLLDLIFSDGAYRDPLKNRLHILRNEGNWTFTDVTETLGFPLEDTTALGLALADVNNDGTLDIFVAHANRLFVSGPTGQYRSAENRWQLVLPKAQGEWWPCGAVFGDLNGDDLLDLVITVHGQPGMIFIYQNRGIQDGVPQFTEIRRVVFPPTSPITRSIIKGAQVALRDMDNDGRLDVALSMLYADQNDRSCPFILRNLGNNPAGVPQFAVPPVERILCYYAPGAVVDLERDGRLDLILPAWFDETANLALRNMTPGGNWLQVHVKGTRPGFNPMGIGAIIRAYRTGQAGQATALLARYDLSIGNGYATGEEALAHLGLGAVTACDLVVTWQGQQKVLPQVKVNQQLLVEFGPVPSLDSRVTAD